MSKNGGYVYLLCDLDRDYSYKIGVTRGKIEDRIKKLQTGNSGEIQLISFYKTDIPFFIEKHLHFKYLKKNIRNEWFDLTNEEALNFRQSCKEIEEMHEIMEDNPFFNKKK